MSTRERLVGMWGVDPLDVEGIAAFGHSTMVFLDDGSLIYTILGEDSDQVMNLTYSVDGDLLVTNQPSRPHEERTKFAFAPDGSLVLTYGSKTVRYVRLEEE